MNTMPDARREKEIFEHALDLSSAEERQRYIRQASGEDRVLFTRVLELLQALDEAKEFLTEHPTGPGATVTLEVGFSGEAPDGEAAVDQQFEVTTETTGLSPLTEKVGDTLGAYRLLAKIGEGGCGTVYLAEQLRPLRRRVALKVVKLGMDTRQVIARFEAERQTLALMDHPHIARVFDAGCTDTGRPYFVMELVQGVRITQFCNERRLSLRERLELFVQVCSAIQHAHQKGIIHRDIKPSNILVAWNDGVPVPKVIDFGIAKAAAGSLTEQTLFTKLEQFLGTPAYMSPEQAGVREVDIDTRSDIYSLGVVLYELLTGRTPFDGTGLLRQGIEELILTLREVEPPCPSRCLSSLAPVDLEKVAQSQRAEVSGLIRTVRGDLDWIVTKCLEKNRSRRYDTANSLAVDIRRHLDCEPIIARPPSTVYRLHKTFCRNRLTITALGTVVLALAVGIGMVIAMKLRENKEYRQRFYFYQVGRAEAAIRAGHFDQLTSLLSQCPVEHRHWEWRYLESQVNRWSWRPLIALDQPLRRLLLSHQGDLMALISGGQVGTIRIAEFPLGRTLSQIEMAASIWSPLALDAQGEMLAGVPHDDPRVIHLWHTRTAQRLRSFHCEHAVTCIAFSPSSRLLAAGGGPSHLDCWDLENGSAYEPSVPVTGVTALAFSPDGRDIALGTKNGEIQLVSVASGQPSAHYSAGQDEVRALAFSPDGKKLVSCQVNESIQRNFMKLWNREHGHSKDLGVTQGLNVQFSPDGHWIMSGGFTFWDSSSGEMVGKLRLDPSNHGMATCFHPNGEIVSAGTGGEVVLITPDRLAAGRLLGHQASLRIVRLSPDGRTAASAGLEREVRLWDVANDRESNAYTGHSGTVSAVAWSPDGRALVSGNSTRELHCWDPQTLRVLWTNSLDRIQATSAWWLEFSLDGSQLLSCGENGVLGLWDSRTGASLANLVPIKPAEVMDGAAWSPDGRSIAGLFKDRVTLWKVEGWVEQWSVPVAADRCIRFSPNGHWLAHGNVDGSVSLRETGRGRLVRSFERHENTVKSVVFSPDGRRLFSGGADGTVRVWDTDTGDGLLRLNVTGNRLVWSIDLSRDGTTLAAADSDGVVTLWKTATTPTL